MQKVGASYQLSASDLTAHLACAHRTNLDRALADGGIPPPPTYSDPMLEALIQRGRKHEAAYVASLSASGLTVEEISDVGVTDEAVKRTTAAMAKGVDIIVQGALRQSTWGGRPDILRKVDRPSNLGAWSYEALDTKLARETTGATVLQLCLYSDLLTASQGVSPESSYAVTPGENRAREEAYRIDAYAAFYRRVKRELEASVGAPPMTSYPEPVAACDTCRWFSVCDKKRRDDDHLTFVAGLGHTHVNELRDHGLPTLTAFANTATPLAWKPRRGAIETYEKLHRQAKVQFKGKQTKKPEYELIEHRDGLGLARLPEPSDGDIFLDFEGDPFVGTGGLEYLLGYAFRDDAGALVYKPLWAITAAQEKLAFETFIDFVIERLKQHADLHIYHYAAYEPAALKRLMGRYATREEELDGLLRSERFVDLLSAVRNGVRASVESYSIKRLEQFYGFARQALLPDVNRSLARVQAALELDDSLADLDDDRDVVERYNEDDCRSTEALRLWLEQLRAELIAAGALVERPIPKAAEATERVTQRLAAERAMAERLAGDVPVDAAERNEDEQARWLMAQTLGWHRREDKASWHEHFRLAALSPEELLDERCGLAGLVFDKEIEAGKAPIHRYRFPPQETELREGDGLRAWGGVPFGSVRAISAAENWIDIKKRKDKAQSHVSAVYEFEIVDSDLIADALMRIAGDFAENGLGKVQHGAARDLLLRVPPRPRSDVLIGEGEAPDQAAVRVIGELSEGVLPIQGPPGAGKTFTGAHMIAALVAQGKRVGVTANSHKVIIHLLEEAIKAGERTGVAMTCAHKGNDETTSAHAKLLIDKKPTKKVLDRLGVDAQVLGGTAWFWSDPDAARVLDVLFVDEAAQMSVANVLAVSQAAKAVVLLGDPRQLEQPSKGSHPEGSEISALDHILKGARTIGDTQGIFLAETWRLHPNICSFTSELFYESRLLARAGLDKQRIDGALRLVGTGLRYLPVAHSGNQNTSVEEVAAIKALVDETLAGSPTWVDRDGNIQPLTLADILIVAPYNAQVFALKHALPNVRIGTVDKFQGQEAPIVIYSLTSSSSGDAPRGMEFLYSLNRLNVATSRAKAICVLVASPTLFEAECRTPRQMELANALCRYREVATPV